MAEHIDTANRLNKEVCLPESELIAAIIEDCRTWMIQHMEYIEEAALPALPRMGKLFWRLQNELYNAVVLPRAKQAKVLSTSEKSLKIGETISCISSSVSDYAHSLPVSQLARSLRSAPLAYGDRGRQDFHHIGRNCSTPEREAGK